MKRRQWECRQSIFIIWDWYPRLPGPLWSTDWSNENSNNNILSLQKGDHISFILKLFKQFLFSAARRLGPGWPRGQGRDAVPSTLFISSIWYFINLEAKVKISPSQPRVYALHVCDCGLNTVNEVLQCPAQPRLSGGCSMKVRCNPALYPPCRGLAAAYLCRHADTRLTVT